MSYEYQKNGKLSDDEILANAKKYVPFRRFCAGCNKFCDLSMRLGVTDGGVVHGGQDFYILPLMYVGNKRLYVVPNAEPVADNLCFNTVLKFKEAESIYSAAADFCQKTCKHSKMR